MNNPEIKTDEDIVLEVYLKLILKYKSEGKDYTLLEERYDELMTRKSNR
jgi:hypothetical protein